MKDTEPTATSLTVHLLDRDYQVNCPPDKREALLAAAAYLDQRFCELRSSKGTLFGMEKLAITVALNLAHEVLTLRREASPAEPLPVARVLDLAAAVAGALQEQEDATK